MLETVYSIGSEIHIYTKSGSHKEDHPNENQNFSKSSYMDRPLDCLVVPVACH